MGNSMHEFYVGKRCFLFKFLDNDAIYLETCKGKGCVEMEGSLVYILQELRDIGLDDALVLLVEKHIVKER